MNVAWKRPISSPSSAATRLMMGLLACLLLLVSCGEPDEVVEIRERMFLTHVRQIYETPENYLGKTIRLEGMYSSLPRGDSSYHLVYREDGCCGGMVGFEFTYDGKIPEKNDWIQVVGVLEEFDLGGEQMLVIRAKTVKVMSERGKEAVTQ